MFLLLKNRKKNWYRGLSHFRKSIMEMANLNEKLNPPAIPGDRVSWKRERKWGENEQVEYLD